MNVLNDSPTQGLSLGATLSTRPDWRGRRALVTGVTGQDGFYLARFLIACGCEVVGVVRAFDAEFHNAGLEAVPGIRSVACELEDLQAVAALMGSERPDVVYHLAAQSSVKRSWEDPLGTARTNAMGTMHLLEALRAAGRGGERPPAMIIAGSCDVFDHDVAGPGGVTPETPFKSTNPYSASKTFAHQMVRFYRHEFGLRAAVAVMFNHTSPRRPEMFVERGIVRGALRVARGLAEKVVIGSMETRRDWSWAPELMEGFAALGMLDAPCDLVLASGNTMTVGDWVHEAFKQLKLDEARHLEIDASRLHGGDRPHTFGNIELAREKLGWVPRATLEFMVGELIAADAGNELAPANSY